MLYKVEASLTAAHLMSNLPGLRARVEEMLSGILETAEELRRLQGMTFETTTEQPMRVHIGNYIVSYMIDVDRRTAKVVFVEMVSREPANPGVTKAC